MQALQSDLSESEVRRSELEGHVRQSSTVSIILILYNSYILSNLLGITLLI